MAKTNQARFAAIDYVSKLEGAPDGSRLTSTQMNVLKSLAQLYRVEVGFAWPSMRELAKRCSISVRHCRRAVKSLELKGVIKRVYMCRSSHGPQTSNGYCFTALNDPTGNLQSLPAQSNGPKVPRTRMTADAGQKRQRQQVIPVPPPQTNASESLGHPRPPIESLGETLSDFLEEFRGGVLTGLIATKTKVQIVNSERTSPDKTRNSLAHIEIARIGWESALQTVREANGAKEFRKYGFPDLRVSEVRENSNRSLTMVLRSPNPEKAICGIKKFEWHIARTLSRYYGCDVKLKCLGDDVPTI